MYWPGWNTNVFPYAAADFCQMTTLLIRSCMRTRTVTGYHSDFRYNPVDPGRHAHGVKMSSRLRSGDPAFRTMVSDPTARSNFVAKLTAFCVSNNYDGVDYDWEAPQSAADRTNFTLIVQQTRAASTRRIPRSRLCRPPSNRPRRTDNGRHFPDAELPRLVWRENLQLLHRLLVRSGLTAPLYR